MAKKKPAQKRRNVKKRTKSNFNRFFAVIVIGLLVLFCLYLVFKRDSSQKIQTLGASTSTSEFGFNTHLTASNAPGIWENLTLPVFKQTIDELASRNQKWVRFSIAPWEATTSLTRTSVALNEANLRKYDEAINYAKSKGLKVYLATSLPDSAKNLGPTDYVNTSKTLHTALAKRYKGKINVWQFANEADSHNFRDYAVLPFGDENKTAYRNEFYNLLTNTKAAIKSVDSSVKFTTNVGRYPANDAMFSNMTKFLDKIASPLDVIALDLYADGNYAGLSTKVTAIQKRYNKPIIIAETGIPTGDGRFTEAQQGEYISNTVNELKLSNPMAIIVYQYWDTLPATDTTESSFGIKKTNGTNKSSYETVMGAMNPSIPEKKGLLRIETVPATQATITIYSYQSNSTVSTSQWSVDWKSFTVGNYRVTFTLSPTNGLVVPPVTRFSIQNGKTTEIVANFASGSATVTYK